MLSPARTARLRPPIKPPGISTSIDTSPEMNIIAPASETSCSPCSSAITTAGACPSRTFASIEPILLGAGLPHLPRRPARALVHAAAPLVELRRRLDAVDGRLRGLELVTLLDDRARLGELAAKLLGTRIGAGRSRRGKRSPVPRRKRPGE